jgi:type IX secretion system PorP/SprF family membrane protein
MKKMKCWMAVMVVMAQLCARAQDPAFSQFFSSPLNINPALTGKINADWRAISNLRDQWIGPASPYITGTISYDRKVMQNKIANVEESDNVMGVGGMMMYDVAMGGIAKSIYASANVSYTVKLAEGYVGKHKLTAGFGTTYARKTVDFNRLDWEEQWVGTGFNTSLPTGEVALSNMKPYFSVSAGMVYTYVTEKSNIDIGAAAYHLNRPKQTFLEDANQYLAMRKVAHANFETYLNEDVVLNVNGIYQQQTTTKYFSVGGALGYFLSRGSDMMINAGVWYWSKNAIIPYIGLAYGDKQFGFSYDLTTSKLNQATRKPNTFELSIIFRGINRPSAVIPCPWK